MKAVTEARYHVRDMQRFLDEFNKAGDLLRRYGFTQTWLHRDADNQSRVIVVHEVEDLDRAREFYRSDEYRKCRQEAGVGQPEVTFMERLVPAPEPAAR